MNTFTTAEWQKSKRTEVGERVVCVVDEDGSYFEVEAVPGGVQVRYSARGSKRMVVVPDCWNVTAIKAIET